MNVVVVGAGGYLGIPICNALVESGHKVFPADRWFFGFRQISGAAYSMRFDIRDSGEELFNLVGDDGKRFKFDAVIDLAGLSNDASAEIDPELTRQINEEGGKKLATLAKQAGVTRYVYSSSASVYGSGAHINLNETDQAHPLTAYAMSKVLVENHLRSLAGDGFEPVILRNATVFGLAPRMRFDLAVNIMTLRAYKENVIYVMGQGSQWRPFLHISDVVRAFIQVLEAPADLVSNETFNVGDDRLNCTIRQVAGMVQHEFPQAKIHIIPEDPDARSYNLDFSKIRGRLGFVAGPTIAGGVSEIKTALENGLKDTPEMYTVQYYKSLICWAKKLEDIQLDGRIL